jgi:hypothetical protein
MKKRAKIALVGSLSYVMSPPVLADLNDGLIAYNPFNGNANDESGNAHNGTEHGSVSYTAGKIGQAGSYEGVDNLVTSTFGQQQDTGLIAESSRADFFKGNQYTRYNIDTEKAEPNYPSSISCCWPGLWSDSIDAAVNWGNGKVYLFKGTQYVRYDIKEDRVDSGYPRRISGNWPGLWSNGIDAAINWGNGKVYLFKGTQYVRYDIKTDRVESGYPRRISGNWPGLWSNGIDAAINWGNGKVYLFKGTQYVRYDIKTDRVESGYPRRLSGNWPGLWSNGVDAASKWRNGKVQLPSTTSDVVEVDTTTKSDLSTTSDVVDVDTTTKSDPSTKSDVVDVDTTTKSDPSTKSDVVGVDTTKSDVAGVDSTGSQQQDTGRIERGDSNLTGNTGKNPLPELINYVFSTQKSKTLPATSTEKVDGYNCRGIINDEDRIVRLALVTLFYQNGCYTNGTYNHKDYLVEQGVVTDTNNQLSFDAYKIYEPTTKASQFLSSQQAVNYQFPTQEDYTVYRFEDGKINPVLEIPASQVKTNQLTQIKNLKVSKITGSVIYLFVPSRQRVSIFTELANDVEGARVNSTPLVDVLKYRYEVDGTPFDTRQDFDYGPNTHSNVYSRTRQFFLVQNHNQLGIVWQDKENASIRLTWLGKDLKSPQTIELPNSSNEDLAAAIYDEKEAIYYLTIQPGSGAASPDVARTATFYKVDESGQQLAKQELDTSKEGLNMVKFGGQNIASLQYLNEKLGLILGRKMHKSGDGINHQGAIAVVLDANTLKVDKNWGQTSGHSFDSFLTTNSNGEFVGIDLGDNYPRGVHLHKFTAAQWKSSRVVYTFKTKHSTSATKNGSHYPEYSEISGGEVTYYKWSNDNRTYTELGGVIEGKSGYTVIFAGEANSEGKALKNARVGNYLNDSRNIGLVQVISDFENASGGGSVVTDDLVRTNGITETGGFYTYGGSWSEQRNTGIVWLTHYQKKEEENASRLKTVKLKNGQILLLWEKWTADHYVNTYAMVISENGQKQVAPVELGTHVRHNRRDDVWVRDNQMYLIAGDKNEKKLELIVLQLK